MSVTVIDGNDLPAILADAGVPVDEATTVDKTEVKVDKMAGKVDNADHVDDPDDVEDDDGLTPRQKRDFTQAMQKTISKKHRMQKEAEEFAASQYSERQLAENRAKLLEQELTELRAKNAPVKAEPEPPKKPARENFTNESDYVDAMIQWGVDQRLAEKAEEDRVAREQRERDRLVEAATKRIEVAKEVVPDFAQVVGSVDTEVPSVVAGYMQKSEMFAELAYHLAKNQDVLVSLAKLAPDEQLVKIGRIESTLTPFEQKVARKEAPNDPASSTEAQNGRASAAAPSASNTDIDLSKPRGKAAPVITPLDGTGSAGIQKDSKDMNIREAIEDFSKRNNVNFSARKRH